MGPWSCGSSIASCVRPSPVGICYRLLHGEIPSLYLYTFCRKHRDFRVCKSVLTSLLLRLISLVEWISNKLQPLSLNDTIQDTPVPDTSLSLVKASRFSLIPNP